MVAEAAANFSESGTTGGNNMDQSGTEKLFSRLSPQEQERVRAILADKDQTARILQTPQAQALMKKLMGETKNE